MVELSNVLRQLSKVGYRSGIFQRSEVKELCNVLHEDEVILQATNGHYEGGFSLLVATDHRLILVDHKPMFLTLDSIAYTMIQELSFTYRLLNSSIHIYTSNKVLDFSSWNHNQLRTILATAQKAMKDPNSLIAAPPEVVHDIEEQTEKIPEPNMDEVPTMPSPRPVFMNDNTESAYASNSSINTLPVEPADLSTNLSKSGYSSVSLGQRHYERRYF